PPARRRRLPGETALGGGSGSRCNHSRIIPRQTSVTRRRLALFASATVAALLVVLGSTALLLNQRGPAMSEPITVTVHEHQRLADVARDLAAQGVLRHPRLFVLWAYLTGQDRSVHWGEFRLTQPLSDRKS